MISHILIKDFAIIDTVEIDFSEGLNIITGETGAGKSIIIEAVSLALGSRADTAFIRSGKEKSIVQMIASDKENEYVITREISSNGKNICKINGEIVSLSQLSTLCKQLADIHGQYDHQSLLNPDNHIKLIDKYNETEILPVKEKVEKYFEEYHKIKSELHSLLSNQAENERKRDFMKFEFDEIKSANLNPGEDKELESRLELLKNSEKIFESLTSGYSLLKDSSPSAIDGIGKALNLLAEISSYSQDIKGFEDEISDIYYRLDDLTSEIRRFSDNISFSPEEMEETLNRLDLLNKLKKKYGNSLESVILYMEKIEKELSNIENIDFLKEKLSKDLKKSEELLLEESNKLSDIRKQTAKIIENKINSELLELNFKDALLKVEFYNGEIDSQKTSYSPNGIDKLEFLITANKGESPKPLVKVASGGEISRIMLAFKKIIGECDSIPTMIFDEIDTGISGITASIVGKKLLDLSKRHQIICITHLPQIAAFGDHHYKIDKITKDDSTLTTVYPVSDEDKINEIARLLGGINITETTLKSAAELISLSRVDC